MAGPASASLNTCTEVVDILNLFSVFAHIPFPLMAESSSPSKTAVRQAAGLQGFKEGGTPKQWVNQWLVREEKLQTVIVLPTHWYLVFSFGIR